DDRGGMMRAPLRAAGLAALIAAFATHAAAQEPVGCDKFKWPVANETAALRGDRQALSARVTDVTIPLAASLTLASVAEAALPKAPERAPKAGTFAGSIAFERIDGGNYSIALSGPAWLDVIQNDQFLKPTTFSGVEGCAGIRKVVRFTLSPGPLLIQISA